MSSFEKENPSAFSSPNIFSAEEEGNVLESSSDNPALMHSRSSKANSTDYDFQQHSLSPVEPSSQNNFNIQQTSASNMIYYPTPTPVYNTENACSPHVHNVENTYNEPLPLVMNTNSSPPQHTSDQIIEQTPKLVYSNNYGSFGAQNENGNMMFNQYCNNLNTGIPFPFGMNIRNNGGHMTQMPDEAALNKMFKTDRNGLYSVDSRSYDANIADQNRFNRFYVDSNIYSSPNQYVVPSPQNALLIPRCGSMQVNNSNVCHNYKQVKRSYSSEHERKYQTHTNIEMKEERQSKRFNHSLFNEEIHHDNRRQVFRKSASSSASNASSKSMQMNKMSGRAERRTNILRLLKLLELAPRSETNACLENDPPLFQSVRVSGNGQYGCTELPDVKLTLKEIKVWSDLFLCKAEMIATNSGRRIFPSLSVNVSGLNPKEDYLFFMDLVMLKPHVFKHHCGNWIVAGTTDEYPPAQLDCPRIYVQDDSPKSGAFWMESGVNFTRAKITNSKEAKSDQNMMYVYSMHYYIPRIHIVRDHSKSRMTLGDSMAMSPSFELIGSFILPGTQFYTVTAYQNPDVIRVKIKNNPFAKGFRNRQSEQDQEDLQLLAQAYHQQHRSQYAPATASAVPTNTAFGGSCNMGKPIDYSINSGQM